MRTNGEKSDEFDINQGVKQGGVLSPALFNFFINDLIEECLNSGLGAMIGDLNVLLFIVMILYYSVRPKLIWTGYFLFVIITLRNGACRLTRKNRVCSMSMLSEASFTLIMNVDQFIYLGLPIGHQDFVKDYWRNKMRKVELASFALKSLGVYPN